MPIPKLPLQLLGLTEWRHRAWWRTALRDRPVVTDWNQRHNAIFVHIPKTAGTSIMAHLGIPPVHDTHASAKVYAEVYPDLYSTAYRFTFVRNPWDRFASSFHFMKSGTQWPMQQRWAQRTIGDLSFADFTRKLERPLFRATVLAERFFWPQTRWLGGDGNCEGVDDIFRFESLPEAMQALNARFGLKAETEVPHLRRSAKRDFRDLYDAEMVDIVARLYASDIAALGYRFDDVAAPTAGAGA